MFQRFLRNRITGFSSRSISLGAYEFATGATATYGWQDGEPRGVNYFVAGGGSPVRGDFDETLRHFFLTERLPPASIRLADGA